MSIKKNILTLLLLSCLSGYSQHKNKEINLVQLGINNTELDLALDSIINQEKKCSYYTCDLIFGITINKNEEDTYLVIDSLLDKNIAFGLNPYGYFYYKKHLFLVDGDVSSQLLDRTEKKRNFKYLEYDPTYIPKNGEKKKIFVFTDDSFSQWEFLYKNQKLLLKKKTSSCD
ncbi:MAG: hypothetical protein GW771_12110 [Flavobacteriia bacterium]|nr:hypothetical protein [Flavobacteriia bacterium]